MQDTAQLLREEKTDGRQWETCYRLRSGAMCVLKRATHPLHEHHRLLIYPGGTPDVDEQREMLNLAFDECRRLAFELFEDAEAYTFEFCGLGTRSTRWRDFHVHIHPLRSEEERVAAILPAYLRRAHEIGVLEKMGLV